MKLVWNGTTTLTHFISQFSGHFLFDLNYYLLQTCAIENTLWSLLLLLPIDFIIPNKVLLLSVRKPIIQKHFWHIWKRRRQTFWWRDFHPYRKIKKNNSIIHSDVYVNKISGPSIQFRLESRKITVVDIDMLQELFVNKKWIEKKKNWIHRWLMLAHS